MLWMEGEGCLHRLGRHDGGSVVVWWEVVGEGCKAVVCRGGRGVWRKSGGVCSLVGKLKCWEGHCFAWERMTGGY